MKNLGITSDLFLTPIYHKIKEKNDRLNLVFESSFQIAKMLREEKLDAAFLSPIAYAMDHSLYSIIPEVAASSEGVSNVVCLYFNENLKEIKTIATDLINASEMVLTKLILLEKYSSNITFIASELNLDKMLQKADAALIVGDYNRKFLSQKNKLDLVDEWSDMMELPYVHGIWTTRKDKLSKDDMKLLIDSAQYGSNHLTEVASNYNPDDTESIVDFLTLFSYKMDEKVKTGLIEFIRMAYYYDIIKDLPDFEFETTDTQNPSLN